MTKGRKNLLIKGAIWAVAIGGIAFASKFAQRSASASTRDDCESWARARGDTQLVEMCSQRAPVTKLLEHVALMRCERCEIVSQSP